MIKKKTMYEASDGTLLPSKDAAIYYEQQCDLHSYIDENPIYTGGAQKADGQDFMVWLKDHPRVFVKLLPEDMDDASKAAYKGEADESA